MPTMQDRLDEIEARYDELTRELSRPEVAADLARLRDLGKRHAELEEIVSTYRAYRQAMAHAEDARSMAKEERDPEMAEFLRSEEADADRRAADLERQLEVLLIPNDPNDDRDEEVEIRAGTGGQEAAIFESNLYEK